MKHNDIENIYKTIPLKEIPWNIETPPDALVKLIENEFIKPCKAIDLGCGAGNYAIYLSKKGFDVTGIDVSPTSIKHAEENAIKKDVKCNFIVADVIKKLDMIKERFDFAYDWTLMHHIYPEERKRYVKNVYEILNPHGKYLSVCFSEKDSYFEGEGKYRKTPLGTTLYFSSQGELKELFETYFIIKELKTIEIKGKFEPHMVNYAFVGKK